MTQYNTLNVKLANSQLNKLKSEINNGTEVVFKFFITCDNSNNEANFPHKLQLTETQASRIHKDFGNGSSAKYKVIKNPTS